MSKPREVLIAVALTAAGVTVAIGIGIAFVVEAVCRLADPDDAFEITFDEEVS